MDDADILFEFLYGEGIFRMSPDGTFISRITGPDVSGMIPEYSRDNRKIAFGKYYMDGIYIMNSDGSNITDIFPDGGFPTWSPNGNKIAFVIGDPSINHRLYVVNIDGSDPYPLLDEAASEPKWSPDGSKIVYSRYLGGIGVVNPDGSDTVVLLESGFAPSWSPDGNQIAYVSFNTSDPCPEDAYAPLAWYYIWIMNSDGTNNRKISSQRGYSPSWSPDGIKIVYDAVSSDLVYDAGINVASIDGSDEHQIINFGHKPSWSNPRPP